jgi:polyhydroxyalkanoate synthesis regulator phasin
MFKEKFDKETLDHSFAIEKGDVVHEEARAHYMKHIIKKGRYESEKTHKKLNRKFKKQTILTQRNIEFRMTDYKLKLAKPRLSIT